MNIPLLLTLTLCVSAAAQPAPLAKDDVISIEVTAIKVQYQGLKAPSYDKRLLALKPILTNLKKFDTFTLYKKTTTRGKIGKETRIPIDNRYTLFLKPLNKDISGRIRCNVRITMKNSGKQKAGKTPGTKKAKDKQVLACTLKAVPGKTFRVSGLKLENGQLELALNIKTAKKPLSR